MPPSNIQKICYIAISVNIILKILVVYSLTSQFKSGVALQRKLYKPLKYFMPTISMPKKGKFKKVMWKRLVAITWIEVLSTISMGALTIIAVAGLKPYPHFINDAAGIPLTSLMALKSLSSLFVSFSLLRNIDLGDFFKEFGCVEFFGCSACYKKRRKRLKEKRGFSAPKVLIDEEYITSMRATKLFDLMMGLWVWIGLGWALRLSSFRAPKPVRVILSLALVVQILSDILVPLLFIVIGWFARVDGYRRRRRVRMDGGGADGLDYESSSEDESGSSSSSSSSSASSSSEDDSSSGSEEDSSGSEDDNSDNNGNPSARASASADRYKLATAGSAAGDQRLEHETYYAEDGSAYYYDPNTGQSYDDNGYYDEHGQYHYYNGADESRYFSAAATYRGAAHDSNELEGDQAGKRLDRAVACTPQEFSEEWDALRESHGFSCRTENTPLMAEIMALLTSNNFFVIASGVLNDGIMTLYVLGQYEGSRCLMELKFDTSCSVLTAKLKASETDVVPVVVRNLNLKDVFGSIEEGDHPEEADFINK